MTLAPGPHRVAAHRSLLVRLLSVSLLIAVLSIASTAWLAVTSTTRALQQEQGQGLADTAQVYDTLIAYAATHPSWAGVQGPLDALAHRQRHGIRLTTPQREPIAASGSVPGVARAQTTALVDPLNVVPGLFADAGATEIDARAVGPYRLPTNERDRLARQARRITDCLELYNRSSGVDSEGTSVSTRIDPAGRPHLTLGPQANFKAPLLCRPEELNALTRTESTALAALNRSISRCLTAQGLKAVQVGLDFTVDATGQGRPSPVQNCVDSARRAQLAPYVAPAALLFLDDAGPADTARFTLSGANIRRIVLVTTLVLVLTMALTVLVGLRLVRPLRGLIRGLQQPSPAVVRFPGVTDDEIGVLERAFNDLSDRREQLETQRKAMISDIAHELRTPLSNVRGWLQAAEDNLTARDQALTASLLEEALHLQRIIDDLQDLAQADAGELRLQRQRVQLAELLALIAHTHRGQADVVGVTLRTDALGGLWVSADPTRLRQAIGNLVSNAIRHTPPGGSVTLHGRVSGDDVLIDVVDTGSGIAADELPQVFDRFWRADKSRSRANGGSGLGLAITRQLVRAHGGDISVRSEPGRETTFSIRLPRHSVLSDHLGEP